MAAERSGSGVDIQVDLNVEDETGFVWAFLHRAGDPSIIRPGAVVVAGDSAARSLAEVVDLVEEEAGTIVHLRLLPGPLAAYVAALNRTGVTV